MQNREIEIINKLGLHARASAKLTQLAGQFQSEVWLSRIDNKGSGGNNGSGSRRVNAKSIMGVMTLAASKGSSISIEITGADEAEAMLALVTLIGDCFGEGE